MRESIGTVSLLNFIIFFILLVFAFLMGTFSYYKAYRVNNAIVSSIEKFEGYNELSVDEIEEKLSTLGYERTEFRCRDKNGYELIAQPQGYCIYESVRDYDKDTDVYTSYQVTTVIKFQFPIVQNLLRLRVDAKTNRLYDFEASRDEVNNINEYTKATKNIEEMFSKINGGGN